MDLSTNAENFTLAPSAGGGIAAWAAAFGRKLATLLDSDPMAVVISQVPAGPYVQMIVPHGPGIWLEATSNRYLSGTPWQLDATAEAALSDLGSAPPPEESESASDDHLQTRCPNWSRAAAHPIDPYDVTAFVVATLISVYRFSEDRPWELEINPAPCDGCWETGP